ncbi:MAG: DUF4113 domain-containing protein [Alphaproteobacteria bacterium]
MQAVDAANRRFGRDSVTFGFAPKDASWRMRQERRSPSYTTKWADLPQVLA